MSVMHNYLVYLNVSAYLNKFLQIHELIYNFWLQPLQTVSHNSLNSLQIHFTYGILPPRWLARKIHMLAFYTESQIPF